ncbi:zinc metalloprotease HtpX [Candidatus Micrarchaeota archaeon CG10_big_fil_rev_8_21_14_0_10_45_29]|nr:MAG: zinc metalloprotease HtpX [Candidatus Micrarchaeota archaeon CG10_big_fil_rev_8_21_14_0_10_45_29]
MTKLAFFAYICILGIAIKENENFIAVVFMASFWDIQRKNKLYSYALVGAMIPIVIVLVWFAGYIFDGGSWIFPFAIALSLIYSIGGYYYGDKIVLSASGAKLAEGKDFTYLNNVCEGLSLAAGIPTPKLYVMNDSSPNAFATGRDPKHASIAVTTGLMQKMNRSEIEGVIAHEMSHIKNFDIKFMTAVVVLVGLISIIAEMMGRMFWFGRGNDRGGKNGLLLIIGIFLVIFGPLMAQLVRLAISRKREFLADASAAQLTRNPGGLASALEKLKGSPALKKANDATAPLFISDPSGAGEKKSFFTSVSHLFSTHPPLDARIKALKGM